MSAHDAMPRQVGILVSFEPIPIGFQVEIKGRLFRVVARTKRGLALRRVVGHGTLTPKAKDPAP